MDQLSVLSVGHPSAPVDAINAMARKAPSFFLSRAVRLCRALLRLRQLPAFVNGLSVAEDGHMRGSLIIVISGFLFAAESRAAEVDVTAAEAVVRRAPFDVRAEVGRVHAGDKLSGADQASGDWRFVQYPRRCWWLRARRPTSSLVPVAVAPGPSAPGSTVSESPTPAHAD